MTSKDAFGSKPRKKYVTLPVYAEDLQYGAVPPVKRCPRCGLRTREEELAQHWNVCPACGHHFPLAVERRLELVADAGSFEPFDETLRSVDVLGFPGYADKLAALWESGRSEAIVTGRATVGGEPVVLGVMDSEFMMGSMGSVVGEKVTRAFERALEARLPVIMITASGGARMQEGMVSLLQMAKTSAAVGRFSAAGLLYISVLTHPTTGGVTASFATLADIILAEPGALVLFAGPRVIEQTIQQKLPPEFQRAEACLQHGLVDAIVPRQELKAVLARLLALHRTGG
jgi:acetyl-CoA carboxylase carboxyl transferase subunit beta